MACLVSVFISTMSLAFSCKGFCLSFCSSASVRFRPSELRIIQEKPAVGRVSSHSRAFNHDHLRSPPTSSAASSECRAYVLWGESSLCKWAVRWGAGPGELCHFLAIRAQPRSLEVQEAIWSCVLSHRPWRKIRTL